MTLVYVIAGEASGDVLGARLIAALRARRPGLQFAGIGGDRMAELGVPSLFDFRELAPAAKIKLTDFSVMLWLFGNCRRFFAAMGAPKIDV